MPTVTRYRCRNGHNYTRFEAEQYKWVCPICDERVDKILIDQDTGKETVIDGRRQRE